MFGIGFGEMLVIGVLILIAVGPDKLPIMVKTVAKTYRQFRRAATEIRSSTGIDDFLRDEELKELAELRKQKLALMGQKPAPPMVGKPAAPIAGKPEAPIAGKPAGPIAGKPTAPAGKPAGPIGKPVHAAPDDEGAPIPATKSAPGLMLKQRIMETPPQGVDISEARAAEHPAIPPTRVGATPTGTEKA